MEVFKPLHRSSTSPKRPFQTASLEDEIGALIFIRDSSVLKLAPTGTELFDYSERMLELQHQVMQLGKSKKEMLGAVRIGVISSQRDCNRKPRRRQKSHLCDICWRDDGARLQIKTAAEVFADSAYEENGHLLNRKIPGAVLHNPLEAAERMLRLIK